MTYYKIIGNNFGSFPYKLGLNKLSDNDEEFDPTPVCGPGGLYFCELEHIFGYFGYGNTVCRVTIPPGARVVSVENKFKANQIYIEEMLSLEKPSTFELLVEEGVDLNACENAPLRWASEKGHIDIVKFLIKNGADARALYDSPLYLASKHGHKEVVEFLLENGAFVSAGCERALRMASSQCHTDIVKILLEKGANPRADNSISLTLASQYGYGDIVQLLIDYGAKVDANDGLALSMACRLGHFEVVKILLKNGANGTSKEDLQQARLRGFHNIAELLLASCNK